MSDILNTFVYDLYLSNYLEKIWLMKTFGNIGLYSCASALLASFLIFQPVQARRYDRLWKQVFRYQEQGFPASAGNVVAKIQAKAKRANNRNQEMAAFLAAASLRQQISPDSFYMDFPELERRVAEAQTPAERAVYASFAAEICLNNEYRGPWISWAEADSLPLEYWSRKDYRKRALYYYTLSLADPQALSSVRLNDYLPLVKPGTADRFLGQDLLHLIGRRALAGMNRLGADRALRQEAVCKILSVYRQKQNREAELYFVLDSIQNLSQTNISWQEKNRDSLLFQSAEYRAYADVMQRFADQPSVAEAYLRASQMDFSNPEKVRLLQTALERYPRYRRISALKNELKSLSQPYLSWVVDETGYPGDTISWTLAHRNIRDVECRIYRIPQSLQDTLTRQPFEKVGKMLQKQGELLETRKLSLKEEPSPYEYMRDTLSWTVPEIGHYALYFTVRSPEGTQQECRFFQSSALRVFSLAEPDGRMLDVVVTDARSGAPRSGAKVEVLSPSLEEDKQLRMEAYTDECGRASMDISNFKQYKIYANWQGDTTWLDPMSKGRFTVPQTTEFWGEIYTDRSLYRPGQTVHLAGVVNKRRDSACMVVPDTLLPLSVYDVSGKEVHRDSVRTDAWGSWRMDYQLPLQGANGSYRVRVGEVSETFSVEEYTRPHFEIVLDQTNLSPKAWGDTLHVSGTVRNYNGSPAANTRVTAQFRMSNPHKPGWEETLPQNDTLQTDAAGRFCFSFPVGVSPDPDKPEYSYPASITCTALHPSGEQAEQTAYLQLVTLRNTLSIQVPEVLNRDSAELVCFHLENTRRELLPGTVFYHLEPAEGASSATMVQATGKYIANKEFPLEGLQGLPSGRYILKANSVIENDTLKASSPVLVYSPKDTRVPVDTAFWFRTVQPDFTESNPFKCEIGSSERDVTLYYTLCYNGKIQERNVMEFSDSLFTLQLPYQSVYGQGATLHLAFVKDNEVYTRDIRINRRIENSRLQYKWHTFRDKLTPGAREEWTLQLTDSKGEPVSARCFFTLYDASLDAIRRHYWRLSLPTVPYLAMPYWSSRYLSVTSFGINFPWKHELQPVESWSDLNLRLLGFATGGGMVKNAKMLYQTNGAVSTCRMASPKMLAEAVVAENEVAMDMAAAPSLETHPAVRKNLQETAYFNAELNTDEEGKVRLSFVVPEALTRWRLLGVAYTKDMTYCQLDTTVVTQQKLMAQLFRPAYLNVGDQARLQTTLTNLSEEEDRGQLTLEIRDAETDSVVFRQEQPFRVAGGESAQYAFTFSPQEGGRKLICRILADGQHHADGEQQELYVLPQTVPVTYARPFVLEGSGNHRITLSGQDMYSRQGIAPSSWFLEYYTDPLFAAVQVLPLLQSSEGRGAEETAAAYYAAVCSAHLLKTRPQIQQWLNRWSDPQYIRQEDEWWKWMRRLNSRLWEETSWSKDYEESGARLEGLYAASGSPEKVNAQRRQLLDRLLSCQQVDGSFSWMPGLRGRYSVTVRILNLLETLRPYSTALSDQELDRKEQLLRDRAFLYLQKNFRNGAVVPEPLRLTPTPDETDFLWLAACHLGADKALEDPSVKDAVDGLARQSATLPYMRKIAAARTLYAYGRDKEALACMNSVAEHLVTDSLGCRYFDTAFWGSAAGEQRLLLHLAALDMFRALQPEQIERIQGMQQWVLLQKRIQGWDNNYLSACAVQALLQDKSSENIASVSDSLVLHTASTTQPVDASSADLPVMRYILPLDKTTSTPEALTVKRQDDRLTWGTAYTQYELSPDQIVREQKEWGALSVEISRLPDTLTVGEEMKAVYMIRADRDYDYMLLHINSAACCQPVWVTSGYRSMQGAGYYLSLEEDGMLLYFDHLQKGNYVLEVPYRVQFSGTYLHGGAELQSYYAPEFRTYLPGKRIHVNE